MSKLTAIFCLMFVSISAFGFDILDRKEVLLHNGGQRMNCEIATSETEIKKALADMKIAAEKIERIEVNDCQSKSIAGDLKTTTTKISIFTSR